MRKLRKKMFDQTWRWAGTFRKSNKNIGVDWPMISLKLRGLLDNTGYQIEHQVFDPDEIVVRFQHQLVCIHAFPNGNGRHARLMADMLTMRRGLPRMTWGSGTVALTSVGAVRKSYLTALRAADQGRLKI